MNTLEQFVANDLGTIVANQSMKIARLQKENLELRERQLEHDELIVNTAFELAKLQLEVTVGVWNFKKNGW